jgi:lipid-A-disaccharide synthase
MSLRVGILAGEPSGDLLGAGLMSALKEHRPGIRFEGIGGERMLAEGLAPLAEMDRLTVNGFVDPLKRLPDLYRILRLLQRRFLDARPDVFIGVDFNVFNLMLERGLKRRGVPTVHYVSPSVYAWRRGRIRRIGRAADLVLALYPFEPPLYAARDVRAVFVGHPLADEITPEDHKPMARERLGISPHARVIALLPGSRQSEIDLLGDRMLDAAAIVAARLPGASFVVPCPSPRILAAMEEKATKRSALDVRLLPGDARLALAAADGALVKSGTSTLEAMLLGTPMVVTYRLGAVSYRIVKALKHSEFVALPNILAGRALVPELLQHEATPDALATALIEEINGIEARAEKLATFRQLHQALRRHANARAADAVLELIDG